ncbi:phosphotransferase [Paenibacillus sp. OAE614]|uniref:phosphotransferase enzyme family protein n=1 Tax=Paenibacillus sp. OAE614 TaxID=2663804 RepID=UPI00178B2E91
MDKIIDALTTNPIARYIPNLSEIQKICNAFEIGELVSIDGELGGLYNVNLKIITKSGQYVIRVHSGLSRRNHIDAEAVLLKKLTERGIPALTPLYTHTNDNYLLLHTRFVQVTPFIQGIPYRHSKEQVYQCGKMLRKFHDVLMEEEDVPVPYWSNYPSHAILQEGMDKLKLEQSHVHESSLIKDVLYLHQKVMEYWLPNEDELIKTIIHADWHPWNVLFDENSKIKFILDFDFLQKGERIHDIAYFLWAIRESENYKELGRSFLNGYAPLTSVEIEMLPVAVARASLFFLCTSSFVSDPVLELQQQMKTQKPYIEWLLTSEGMLSINNLLN